MLALAVALLAVPGVTASAPAPPQTSLLSRASGAGVKGNGASDRPDVSADGRFVAFQSFASNLHPDDPDPTVDVFVRELRSGAVTLVSRAADGAAANGGAARPRISADGRHVAFFSNATNLHPDDTDTTLDVFVRDLVAGTTILASRATGPTGTKGNAGSEFPSISPDGRFVAFRSSATNLDPAVSAGSVLHVYLRDLQTGTTTLVSRADGPSGDPGAGGDSFRPVVASGGRYVAFESEATNLHSDDTDPQEDIFVRDVQLGTTQLVSRATTGAKGDGSSQRPDISADGRLVSFFSASQNLHPDDGDGVDDIFVRDLHASTTTLVSRAGGASGVKANNGSEDPEMSADGRFVAFQGFATNLDPADADVGSDVFVRDLEANTTRLMSRASGEDGANADNQAITPAISGDGGVVSFASSATNLDPADLELDLDVYARVLQPPGTTSPPADTTPPGTTPPSTGPPIVPPLVGDAVPFKLLKVAVNRRKGTVGVTAQVPGAGRLTAAATAKVKRPKKARRKAKLKVASARRNARSAGKVKLTLKPKGKAKRMLRSKGRLRARLTVRYRPAQGRALKTTRKVTFRFKKPRSKGRGKRR